MRLALVVLTVACHAPPARAPAPTTGAISGQVRDRVTGDPVEATLTAHDQASFAVASARTVDGEYTIAELAPGTYDMVVVLSGTTMQLTDIPVAAGRTTAFDVPVDVGAVEVPPAAYGALESSDIRTYTPRDLARSPRGRLEGTVTDTVSRERVVGAVVVATSDALPDVLTGVSDDRGRYRFDDLPPGDYTLSAFYQVARRGQIEVRRSGVAVPAETAVIVPLFVEVSGTE